MNEKHPLLERESPGLPYDGSLTQAPWKTFLRRRSRSCDHEEPLGECWMSGIHDDIMVSSLSIPGTHDSAAFTSSVPFISTQNLNITQQLDLGIRYFDLRCGLRENIVEMVHGISFLGLRLEQVLEAMYTWLGTHPTEALIVQIKHDREDEKSSIHFSQGIINTLTQHSERWRTANTTPTLGELRGRIQLFRRFAGSWLHAYGIDVSRWPNNPELPFTIHTWRDVQVTIQDHYTCPSAESLPSMILKKGGDVAGLLKMASTDVLPAHWYINFTSAYEINIWHQLTPREIAVGDWWGFKWEEGINVRLRNSLQRQPGRRRYGIIAMDYPELGSDDLVTTVIKANFGEKSDWCETLLFVLPLLILITFLVVGVVFYFDSSAVDHSVS
ncbi:hypothetical protein MBLNU230_g7083t1 [Neophaeotheca triangularis]